jgi:hypothetical protein
LIHHFYIILKLWWKEFFFFFSLLQLHLKEINHQTDVFPNISIFYVYFKRSLRKIEFFQWVWKILELIDWPLFFINFVSFTPFDQSLNTKSKYNPNTLIITNSSKIDNIIKLSSRLRFFSNFRFN